jgi:hypothetical protein
MRRKGEPKMTKREHEAAISIERCRASLAESALRATIAGEVKWIRAGNGYRIGYFGLERCEGGIVIIEFHPKGQGASYSIETLDDWRAQMTRMASLGIVGSDYLPLARVADEIALIRSRLYETASA